MDVRAELDRIRRRLTLPVLARTAQMTLAAGAAWVIARRIHGGGATPFFAPIGALIGLGAERGRRGKQAMRMIAGVALGIVVGAAVVALAGNGTWQLVAAVLVTLLVAAAADAPQLARSQAAASAVLTVALHRPGTNLALQRLVDALVGGGIAILLAQVLFPIDPLELVRNESRRLRGRLADALDAVATALERGDRASGAAALARTERIDARALEDALGLAREVVRRAPRRRPQRRRLESLATIVHEVGASAADVRAVGTGALRLLGGKKPPPPEVAAAVRAAAESLRTIDPAEGRERAQRAHAAARLALERDRSLGTSVVAHGVVEVADHALRAAEAREADRRLARVRVPGLRTWIGRGAVVADDERARAAKREQPVGRDG